MTLKGCFEFFDISTFRLESVQDAIEAIDNRRSLCDQVNKTGNMVSFYQPVILTLERPTCASACPRCLSPTVPPIS